MKYQWIWAFVWGISSSIGTWIGSGDFSKIVMNNALLTFVSSFGMWCICYSYFKHGCLFGGKK